MWLQVSVRELFIIIDYHANTWLPKLKCDLWNQELELETRVEDNSFGISIPI